MDVSTDLHTLASVPMVVVCAGAKSILNLSSTTEILETNGVPVIGYKTNELPAFYSISSGLPVDYHLDDVSKISNSVKLPRKLGLRSSVLVTVPPPAADALDEEYLEKKINQALEKAKENNISGSAITPFLLSEVAKTTKEKSLKANHSLLLNNARVVAKIAISMVVN